MKRLLKQFSLVFVLPLLFSGIASASNHFWKVEMSDPTSANQLRTFNVEYTALSVDPSDQITVALYQDGDQIDEDTTLGGGDSGSFEVTVEEDDTYVYQLIANSSLDSETRSSEARAVTVETPEDQDDSIITVEPELTPEQEAGLIAPGGGVGGDGDVAGTADDTGSDGDGDANGEVSDEAATTTSDDEGDVLGAEDTAAATDNTLRIILAVALLALLAYYWFFYRNGRVNPFSKTEE